MNPIVTSEEKTGVFVLRSINNYLMKLKVDQGLKTKSDAIQFLIDKYEDHKPYEPFH